MAGAWGTHARLDKCEGRDHLEDLGIDGRILLKFIFKT
jgi:hypothetical protein